MRRNLPTDPSNPLWGEDWPRVRSLWPLDPDVTFLNHGSFGATPTSVLEAQRAWQDEMERQPVQFLDRRLPELLEQARRHAAGFLHTDADGLAFVPNATAGVATVLASIPFEPGDRVVLSDHSYPAVRNAVTRACSVSGAEPVVVEVPLPLPEPDRIVAAFGEAISDRTRLVIVDQVTSPTGAIFPAAEVASACRERGVLMLVDGAHAPGMLPVDLGAVGADFYTGNFHKWCCAPKGAAALAVGAEHRDRIHPVVTSHGLGGSFRDRFDWTGTADPSPYLCVPAALAFLDALGWERVRRHNHELVAYGQRLVAEALGTDVPVPPDAFGSMAIVKLPDGMATTKDDALELQAKLYDRTRIEVPFTAWNSGGYVRLSAQAYNRPADYERLAEALPDLL